MRMLLHVPTVRSAEHYGWSAAHLSVEGGQVAGGRTLSADEWNEYFKTTAGFWKSVQNYFYSLKDASDLKVFAETLCLGGELGKKLVLKEVLRKPIEENLIIKHLIDKNAQLMQTEELSLLENVFNLEQKHARKTRNATLTERFDINSKFDSEYWKALDAQDEFVAKMINESLKEGEKAVLFLHVWRKIIPWLDKDIIIVELKDRKKISEFIEVLYKGLTQKEKEELMKYLVEPINPGFRF